jgi:hypothetical protein
MKIADATGSPFFLIFWGRKTLTVGTLSFTLTRKTEAERRVGDLLALLASAFLALTRRST